MNTRISEKGEKRKLLALKEDHFNDLKSSRIKPSSLQEAFISFANTDGGDLYVGIEDPKVEGERIVGFEKQEDANDIIHTLLEETNPSVENVIMEFIDFDAGGLVLHISIPKSPKVHYTAQGKCFIRVNARKKEIKGERITSLSYTKGAFSYEKQPIDYIEIEDIEDSSYLVDYMSRIDSSLPRKSFLRKQRLLSKKDDKFYPNAGGVLLFDEEPQATLDNRCAIKVYRLRTTGAEYKREQLDGRPETIKGPLEQQVHEVIDRIGEILTDSSYYVAGKLEKLVYPTEAIKEIVVNAVIHRDYSLNDDIHIRIYDNRIEIQSPGKLPGFMTVDNIYDERYSRNPNVVRMLHNLPDPLNHDIGEGLDTARNELRKIGLVAPEFKELDNALLVTIKHQKLATLEDIIVDYLKGNPDVFITNKDVRKISGEEDVNKVKKAFQKLRKQNIIEPENAEARTFDFKYKLKEQ
ncbi:ATP-binding protein [Paenibacillus polymyxa]|uniref:ATP-binding protein n=1 Tax=Paenibacillus polymyxa TaxID=1406 RepID=UPI002AB5303F|nr:ATP-binding protein [Paenibacillus polymyxa]MDY7993798.1 ATP-binding protein [Paenibacillus polymyxa]MDY8120553.1 ATP-binding protein [Paenibacillus polymyxa]